MSNTTKVTTQDIREATQNLNLSDQPLCVHSSLRSFGWVDGGPSAVVDGLLAEGCTVLVPTFSWSAFGVPPPTNKRPERNGWNYDEYEGPKGRINCIYTPDTLEIDKDMGAIPATVVKKPQRTRGNHPLCSFSAVGPQAHQLITVQKPLHVFAPIRALAEVKGYVVLMGVGLKSMALIHLAEQIAGRNLFRRWANGPDKQPMEVEVGGCSDGFDNFEPILSPLMRKSQVGEGIWRIFPAKETLETAIEAIRKNSMLTHCDNPQCDRCNDAVAGGLLI